MEVWHAEADFIDRLALLAVYPNLESQQRTVDIKFINDCLGLSLEAGIIADLLSRMALEASPSEDGKSVSILIPPTRTDVLHDADVMEVQALDSYSVSKSAISCRALHAMSHFVQSQRTVMRSCCHIHQELKDKGHMRSWQTSAFKSSYTLQGCLHIEGGMCASSLQCCKLL